MRLLVDPNSPTLVVRSQVSDNPMAGSRSVSVTLTMSDNDLRRVYNINPAAVTEIMFQPSLSGGLFMDYPGPYPVRRMQRTQMPNDQTITFQCAVAIPLPPTVRNERGPFVTEREALDVSNALTDPDPEGVLSFAREFYPQPFTVPANLSNAEGVVSGHVYVDTNGDVLRLETLRGDFLQVPLSVAIAALLDHDITRNVSQQLPTEPRRHRRRVVRGET